MNINLYGAFFTLRAAEQSKFERRQQRRVKRRGLATR
jgi:hypothetical protein